MRMRKLAAVSRAAAPRIVVTTIQIVCGDCMGDALFPRKTFLTTEGTCSRCAGGNYVLASKLSGALVRHMKKGELGL
jgi:hypothetical protein